MDCRYFIITANGKASCEERLYAQGFFEPFFANAVLYEEVFLAKANAPLKAQINTKIMNKIKFFIQILGSSNWYHGIDKPNFWQFIYQWRIGVKTAYELTKLLYGK